MSGKYTRKNYDQCALAQQTKQMTDPLELIMDPTKYVNNNNLSRPIGEYPMRPYDRIDIESSMMGLDRLESNCDSTKLPFCGSNGCMLPGDPRIGPHITPYVSERGGPGDNAVVTTNMRMPTNAGYRQNSNWQDNNSQKRRS